MNMPMQSPLGWVGILRLGLVQAALGAIVVLTTSTLNRVMVVELALPAMLPSSCRISITPAKPTAAVGVVVAAVGVAAARVIPDNRWWQFTMIKFLPVRAVCRSTRSRASSRAPGC